MIDLDALAGDGFGWWLAGLIDGEGCFYVRKVRASYACILTMTLRADDAPVILEIKERTGLGSISYAERQQEAWSPTVRWDVVRRDQVAQAVALFDRFPLKSKKARDYAIWREAALIWTASVPYGKKHDWTKMAALRAELSAGRKYKESA